MLDRNKYNIVLCFKCRPKQINLGMDQAYLNVTSVDQAFREFMVVYGISENCYKVSG